MFLQIRFVLPDLWREFIVILHELKELLDNSAMRTSDNSSGDCLFRGQFSSTVVNT